GSAPKSSFIFAAPFSYRSDLGIRFPPLRVHSSPCRTRGRMEAAERRMQAQQSAFHIPPSALKRERAPILAAASPPWQRPVHQAPSWSRPFLDASPPGSEFGPSLQGRLGAEGRQQVHGKEQRWGQRSVGQGEHVPGGPWTIWRQHRFNLVETSRDIGQLLLHHFGVPSLGTHLPKERADRRLE